MMSVIVSPGFDAYYCSFYLEGLIRTFGASAIKFSRNDFPNLHQIHGMAFILQPSGRKIYIDARDSPAMNRAAFDWCDTYAKVNVEPERLPVEALSKVLLIGPSFGIQVWNLSGTLGRMCANYRQCRKEVKAYRTRREYFANYWRQYKHRLPLAAYTPAATVANYVFHLSSLWKKEVDCNNYRANFIKACKSFAGIQFEGGFAPRRQDEMSGFEGLTINKRYTLDEYLTKLKRSCIAFNTPAVYSCHGWKLGEFLALGKAIISTPLSRPLPAPLEHGKHVHYVDGSFAESQAALKLLLADRAYREHLERNARNYFSEHLAPGKTIERIARQLGDQTLAAVC